MNDKELRLLRELQKENIWWQLNDVPETLAKPFRRSDYSAYIDYVFDNNKINVIIGPRRIGKSTVLYQLIRFLIKRRKVLPNRILFLSLDRPFFEITKNPISESIMVYEENILKESIQSLKEPVYLFIDEASRNSEWAITLKQFIDLKYNVKYIISGSSAASLYQKSTESLVGRKNDILMLPLKFRDVLRFKNLNLDSDLQSVALILREHFINAITKNDPKLFYDGCLRIFTSIGPDIETSFQIALKDYLLRGGYPEFYDTGLNWEESSKIMREAYFEAIISYDILKVFNSRNPEKLRKVYIFLAMSSGSLVNMSSIQRDLGNISRTALDDYFHQLQETYLINTSLFYKKNRRKIGNELKKVYANDVGMANAVLGRDEEDTKKSDLMGFLAESVAYNHLRRLKFCLESEKKNELFFWRDDYNKEVDFIMEIKNKVIPLEMKFQESIKSEDSKVLESAIKKFKSPFGVLLTKKSFDIKGNVISIPLWFFLLMC